MFDEGDEDEEMILDNLFDRSEMGSDKTSPILNGICTINAEPNNNKEASSDGNPQEGTTDLIKGNIYDDDLSDEKKKVLFFHN